METRDTDWIKWCVENKLNSAEQIIEYYKVEASLFKNNKEKTMSENKVETTIEKVKAKNLIAFTVEHLKSLGNYDNFRGHIAHMRAIPLGDKNEFVVLNKKIQLEDLKNIRPKILNRKVQKAVDSILTKWLNRELTMKTNTLAVDSAITDIPELLTIEDGLLVEEAKSIINKLNTELMSEISYNPGNTDCVMFFEPFKVDYIDATVSIPEEMWTTPMDITRSTLYTAIKNIGFELEPDVLNIIIDENNNAFIIDENMHRRFVMKLFTNADIIVNQVLED